jgi:predicted O-methyltransferase YrrM
VSSETHPIWKRFFAEDPYEGFDADEFEEDFEGWGGSRHPGPPGHSQHIFRKVITAVRPELVIEVGSWKGTSAIHMARCAKKLDLAPAIICVDTWLGSAEHLLRQEMRESLRTQFGYPRLYEQFLANVVKQGQQDLIVPLPQTSENAAQIFRKLGVSADLIYIDAAHEYGPVNRDLKAYWKLLTPGGILLGDDFPRPGVTRAVEKFTRDRGLQFAIHKRKYLIPNQEEGKSGSPEGQVPLPKRMDEWLAQLNEAREVDRAVGGHTARN